MEVIIVIERQTIFDLAIQKYGSVEAVFQLLEDDPSVNEIVEIDGVQYEMGLMSNLTPGQIVKIKSGAIDSNILEHYKRNNLIPISSIVFDYVPLDSVTPDFNQFDFNPEDFH
jgi:hypothetical protein